jgi:hypothetical protein
MYEAEIAGDRDFWETSSISTSGSMNASLLLPDLVDGYQARSRSGCLRTKRAIPRQCQSVRRVSNRRSITAA